MSGEPDQVKWRGVRPIAGVEGVWPSIDAARVNESEFKNSTGEIIVYTVPVDKKLFISSASLTTSQSGNSVGWARLEVRDDSDVDQYVFLSLYFEVSGQMAVALPYMPALEAAAGYDVFLQVLSGTLKARCSFHGWLEDA